MWAWKVAPALAAGCTIVMKPSELTPLTALMMNALAAEAELPAGVLNTVPGLGNTTGDAIARHMDIDKVAFTGSVPTGKRISIAAAESNLKKVTLELGGKSPLLVFASADTDDAAQWTANGIWYNSGQDCCASSRIYVQASVFDRYVNQLRKRALTVAIGAPSDDRTSFGPLISAAQQDKVLGYIASAKEEGARLVAGGRAWPRSKGFYVEPTILANSANKDLRAGREEIFGPVVIVTPFRDEEHALELANDSEYGLAAAVFTGDTRQAIRVARGLDAGSVWVNQYGAVHNNVPFGGFKQSGVGRELGTYGLEGAQLVGHQNAADNRLSPDQGRAPQPRRRGAVAHLTVFSINNMTPRTSHASSGPSIVSASSARQNHGVSMLVGMYRTFLQRYMSLPPLYLFPDNCGYALPKPSVSVTANSRRSRSCS
jgi:aldehyde dehydrogenase (NAD+)